MPSAAISAQTIATQAWIALGIGSPGETMPSSESDYALSVLNRLVDSQSGVDDLAYATSLDQYSLTNTGSFTIGVGATLNGPRPIFIESATIILTVAGADPQTFDLDVVPEEVWATIGDKNATGTVPTRLYYKPAMPLGTIYLHPIPKCLVTTKVEIGGPLVIAEFATLATTQYMPPTYYRMLVDGLLVELAPTYGSVVNPAVVQERARQYKEALDILRTLNRTARKKMPEPPTASEVAKIKAQGQQQMKAGV